MQAPFDNPCRILRAAAVAAAFALVGGALIARADGPGRSGGAAANVPVDLEMRPHSAHHGEGALPAVSDAGEAAAAAHSRPLSRGAARSGAASQGGEGVVARSGPSQAAGPGAWWPLAVVLGVVACCALAARRWMLPARRPGGGAVIHVLSRQYLSNRQSLCLARVGRRVVLLGITPDRISTLSELTDAEEVSSILHAVERGRAGSFTSMFDRFIEREAPREAEDAYSAGGATRGFDRAAPRQLAAARRNVAELIDRVREVSSGARRAAEPPGFVRDA